MTPKRSAQPRQRGPIGRKYWRVDSVFFTTRKAADIFAVSSVPEPILVLALDPANVERIREEISGALRRGYIAKYGKTLPYPESADDLYIEAMLQAIGLTPAKRRGKK